MKKIIIKAGDRTFEARLLETETAKEIYNALPIEGYAQTWGDEIYFSVPVGVDKEQGAKEEVEIGDLAFWPPGSAFCIFFGPTPVSSGNKPCAASPVNVFGKIEGKTDALKTVNSGDLIKVIKKIK